MTKVICWVSVVCETALCWGCYLVFTLLCKWIISVRELAVRTLKVGVLKQTCVFYWWDPGVSFVSLDEMQFSALKVQLVLYGSVTVLYLLFVNGTLFWSLPCLVLIVFKACFIRLQIFSYFYITLTRQKRHLLFLTFSAGFEFVILVWNLSEANGVELMGRKIFLLSDWLCTDVFLLH